MKPASANRKPRPRALKWALWIVGGFALTGVVVFGVLVVPDQVRPVATPAVGIQFSANLGVDPANVCDESRHPEADIVFDARPVEPEATGAAAEDAPGGLPRLTREGYRELARPFPNIEALPESLRPKALECNAQIDDLTSRVLALLTESPSLTFEEADRRFESLFNEYEEKTFGAIWADSPEDLRPETLRNLRAFDKVLIQQHLAIAAEHQNWEAAAILSLWLAGDIPDKKSEWWQKEVYYWRKVGLAGRSVLAYRSLKPAFHPFFAAIREPVLQQVGPIMYDTLKAVDAHLQNPEPTRAATAAAAETARATAAAQSPGESSP